MCSKLAVSIHDRYLWPRGPVVSLLLELRGSFFFSVLSRRVLESVNVLLRVITRNHNALQLQWLGRKSLDQKRQKSIDSYDSLTEGLSPAHKY